MKLLLINYYLLYIIIYQIIIINKQYLINAQYIIQNIIQYVHTETFNIYNMRAYIILKY